MSEYFALLRQWANEAKLTRHQKEAYELHLKCAEVMPLPGNYTYGTGSMKLTGKLKAGQDQLVRMGVIERMASSTTVGMTIYRLKFPKEALAHCQGDYTLEQLIELLIGPFGEMNKFQRQIFRNWIEGYGGKVPLMEAQQ